MFPVSPYEMPPASRPSLWRSIWIGPAGLRAGWGLLLFTLILLVCIIGASLAFLLVVFALNAFGVHTPFDPRHRGDSPDIQALRFGAGELLATIGILLATGFMGQIEKRPMQDYGLSTLNRQRRLQLLWGAATGLGACLLMGVGNIAVGLRRFDRFEPFDRAHIVYWLLGLLPVICVGVCEEALFRGYVQFTLARGLGVGGEKWRGIGFWIAAVLLSVLFAASHLVNRGVTALYLCNAAVLGFILCLGLWYTRSLWWSIGFHALWDWASAYIFDDWEGVWTITHHMVRSHVPHYPTAVAIHNSYTEAAFLQTTIHLIIIAILFLTRRGERSRDSAQALVNPVETMSS